MSERLSSEREAEIRKNPCGWDAVLLAEIDAARAKLDDAVWLLKWARGPFTMTAALPGPNGTTTASCPEWNALQKNINAFLATAPAPPPESTAMQGLSDAVERALVADLESALAFLQQGVAFNEEQPHRADVCTCAWCSWKRNVRTFLTRFGKGEGAPWPTVEVPPPPDRCARLEAAITSATAILGVFDKQTAFFTAERMRGTIRPVIGHLKAALEESDGR